MLVIGLADAGQTQLARTLAAEKLPEAKRSPAIMAIAGAQSTRGDVAGALQTLDGLPKGSRMRDFSQALVAIRQAQQGNVAVAQRVIIGITDQNSLDGAHEWIAKAQAEAGDRKSAVATADLIRDEDRQRQVRATIAASGGPEFFSFRCIRSPFLSTQIAALSLFSNDESWKTKALLTLAAAYRKDVAAVTSGAEKTITLLDGVPAGLERATGFAILALAFSEAGKPKQAENAGDEALKAMSGDLVGISSLFGKPIVIYAIVQLGHYEQIDKILEAAEQNQDRSAWGSAWGDLGAIGAALAAKREDQRLDKVYQQLHKPINRAYLSLGVLAELSRPPEPAQPEGRAR
jgi:tetratricopeptide (TPR) repeat protein